MYKNANNRKKLGPSLYRFYKFLIAVKLSFLDVQNLIYNPSYLADVQNL
jgi:hypothetical protein